MHVERTSNDGRKRPLDYFLFRGVFPGGTPLARALLLPNVPLEIGKEAVVLKLSRMARFLINKVTGGGGGVHDLAAYLLIQNRECGTRLFARLGAQGVVDFDRGFPG